MVKNNSILIVEDAEPILKLLRTLLTKENYQVHTATNGKEALDYLHSALHLPGVILLDLTMPIMDGYKFRDHQRKDSRLASIPVIVMTAAGENHKVDKQMGVKVILKKPFVDPETILDTVARFLGN